MIKKRTIVLFFFIVILGSLLRLYKLGYHNLWFDEAMSVHVAFHPEEYIVLESRPPLYYVILHFWINLLGKSFKPSIVS